MRKSTLFTAAIAVIATVAAAVFLAGGWRCVGTFCARDSGGRISSYDARAEVSAEGGVTVTERITFELDKPQRGIHRDIPTLFPIGTGWYRLPVVVRSVRDDQGHDLHHTDGSSGRSLRVWIGDPKSEYVGTQKVVVTYVVNGWIRPADDGSGRDELRWRLVGDDTKLPVGRFSASVVFPPAKEDYDLGASCIPDCSVDRQPTSVTFSGEGDRTVAVSLPSGRIPKLSVQELGATTPYLPYIPYALLGLLDMMVLARVLKERRAQR